MANTDRQPSTVNLKVRGQNFEEMTRGVVVDRQITMCELCGARVWIDTDSYGSRHLLHLGSCTPRDNSMMTPGSTT